MTREPRCLLVWVPVGELEFSVRARAETQKEEGGKDEK